MKRRTLLALGWSSSWLAAWLLTASSVEGVEFRGRNGTRATHRLAALQVDDDEFAAPALEPMADPAMDSESEGEGDAGADEKPQPAPSRPTPRKTAPSPRISIPPSDHGWGADVVPYGFRPGQQGGPCSDGYCEECPPTGGGLCCNGSWGSVEYVLWWRDKRRTPPLVTTTTTVANQDLDGELGQANTRILLGPAQFNDHLQPGGRVDIGYWLDPVQSWGLGVRFAILGDDDLNYLAGSATNPVLTVPFFNLDPTVNSQDTLVVASPLDNTSGSIQVTGHNQVNTGDLYVRLCGARTDRYRVDLIGGYSFSNILDDMTLRTATTSGQTEIVVRDRFRAKNEYNGGSIGLMSQYDRGPWSVNLMSKVGLTNVHQTLIVDGVTRIDNVTQSLTGLYAQASNSGTISRDRFAAIPELSANWMYRLGRANLSVGYSALYWSNTARAGDQFNPQIDPTQTAARPQQQIVSDNYFVHGLNFGLAWQY